jgi:ABC-type tungstate transport system permease subunit
MRKISLLYGVTLVFLLSFGVRASAYDARVSPGRAVRISEFANSPAVQMLLVALDSEFEKLTESQSVWKTLPSGTAEEREESLRPSVAGTSDMIFTSDQEAARELFGQGLLRSFSPAFGEEIILVGPAEPGDSAASGAGAVMGRVFREGAPFFSLMANEWSARAEQDIWKAEGIEDPGLNKNYVQSSRDDVTAMFQAGDEGAFLLVGEGAFAQYLGAQGSPPVLGKIAGTGVYRKSYVCLVKNSGFRKEQGEAASRFAAWLLSDEARETVDSFEIAGLRPFRWLHAFGAPGSAGAP